jgi:hypothetical protein
MTAPRRSVLQDWVQELTMMQQSVLLTAVRGPDGLPKYHSVKYVLRWYRRCILLSSFMGQVIPDPIMSDGGSFLGPSAVDHPTVPGRSILAWRSAMDQRITDYMRSLDEVPHHFQLHLLHAIEIVGYKHPDPDIRGWWRRVYERLAHDMHLWPETEAQMDARLGDTRDGWLARADESTVA